MKLTLKQLILFIFITLYYQLTFGQDAVVEVNVAKFVEVGDAFYIRYNIDKSASKIELDRAITDFKLDNGPSKSTSSSYTVTNGKHKQTKKTSFTYSVIANKVGAFSIPVATITVDGMNYTSDTLSIHVIAIDNSNSESADSTTSNTYVELTLTKTEAYKQEPIIAELKVYSTANLRSIDKMELPSLDGFLQYEINPPTEFEQETDTLDKQIYNYVSLKTLLLIPVKAGYLKIDTAKITARIDIPNSDNKSSFQDFFSSVQISKIVPLYTDPIDIHIEDFPSNIPNDFAYISARNLNIGISLNDSNIIRDEPFTFEVEISGNANLKFLGTPELELPKNLNLIDSESSNNLTMDDNGLSGNRTFLYSLVADAPDKFEIPAIKLSYFDIDSANYVQIASPAILIDVLDAESTTTTQKINQKSKRADKQRTKKSKSATMIVLDQSGSMLAMDFEPNRRTSAIKEITRFIAYTKQDIGLIIYSAIPYLLKPISSDKKSMIDSLNTMDKIELGNGTATGYSITMALDVLNRTNAKNKSIILLTDGESNKGSINESLAAEFSKILNTRIYIIGISANADHAPLPVESYLGEEHIMDVPIAIKDSELAEVANLSGGNYFRATTPVELYEALLLIDKLLEEKSQANEGYYRIEYTKPEIEGIFNLMYQDIRENRIAIENEVN
jgi:hypothetical protein